MRLIARQDAPFSHHILTPALTIVAASITVEKLSRMFLTAAGIWKGWKGFQLTKCPGLRRIYADKLFGGLGSFAKPPSP